MTARKRYSRPAGGNRPTSQGLFTPLQAVRGVNCSIIDGRAARSGPFTLTLFSARITGASTVCGRFTNRLTWSEIVALYRLTDPPQNLPARYNIAPTQMIPAIRLESGERHFAHLRWGLIPFWAKDPKIAYKTINAKAETVATKPAFREAYRKRPCLIPAQGYFEWQKQSDGSKQPYLITMADQRPFSFAGLWERWKPRESGGQIIETCTIITTTPNRVSAQIHDRAPVILDPEDYDHWLDPTADNRQKLLGPCPDDWLTAYPVNKHVNNARNDDPTCIEPA